MRALEKNKTQEIVDLPKRCKAMGCKWIYTTKYKVDGLVEKYKATLVAKEQTQTYVVDYQDTFAPLAKMKTI